MFGAYPNASRLKRHTWKVLDMLRAEKKRDRKSQQCATLIMQLLITIAENQEGVRIMAGKPRKIETEGQWEGFARIDLSDAEKERFAEWDVQDEDVFVLMADLIGSGYKVSLSFNDKNSTYICALTCRNPKSPNAGYTSSAFANTWYQALRVMLYKHLVVCDGDWSTSKLRPTGDIG